MANPQMETPSVAPVRERLTWQQLCARYSAGWVTRVEIAWEGGDEDDGEVASAVIPAHSKKRSEGLREASALRERERILECAQWFTGALFHAALPPS